jgi:hypothetical protein
MIDKIFVVVVNGQVRRKDSAIRTYKTRESAEKNNRRFLKYGWKIEVAELSLTNITEVKEDE